MGRFGDLSECCLHHAELLGRRIWCRLEVADVSIRATFNRHQAPLLKFVAQLWCQNKSKAVTHFWCLRIEVWSLVDIFIVVAKPAVDGAFVGWDAKRRCYVYSHGFVMCEYCDMIDAGIKLYIFDH